MKKILVIQGPEGSGKTILAHLIASYAGRWTEIKAEKLVSHFGVAEALSGEPTLVIVDDIAQRNLDAVMRLAVSETVVCERLGKEPVTRPTPNFIFCSGDKNPLKIDKEDRRFVVVNL